MVIGVGRDLLGCSWLLSPSDPFSISNFEIELKLERVCNTSLSFVWSASRFFGGETAAEGGTHFQRKTRLPRHCETSQRQSLKTAPSVPER